MAFTCTVEKMPPTAFITLDVKPESWVLLLGRTNFLFRLLSNISRDFVGCGEDISFMGGLPQVLYSLYVMRDFLGYSKYHCQNNEQ